MPAITTDRKTQNAIINYYSRIIEVENELKSPDYKVSIIKSSRGGPHLRISYKHDVHTLLTSIHPCKIKPTDVSISGSYVTQELEITEPLPDKSAKKGDKIYLVVAVSSKGVLKTKQLTPDKLNLTGKKISKSSFLPTVKSEIKKLHDVPDNIKAFLVELMEVSQKSPSIMSVDYVDAISDADVTIIAKDFGEISGAWWYMNNFNNKADSIMYPSKINEPLVDYYIHQGKIATPVSAKANEGAPPSIEAIASVLRNMKFNEPKKEGARKAVIAIADESTVDGIVLASKTLNTPGYAWLKKNMFKGKDFTAADCETILAKYKTAAAILAELDPFYKTIGRSASADITKRIFDSKGKRYGLILSPLGYSLVDNLNGNTTYLGVLNEAAKTINVSQLYIKISKTNKKVDYTVKQFESSTFKFEYNANAGQPSLKKISFKMDKKASK